MRQKSQTRQTGAAKAIKDIRRATRKQYSAEEKIRIVLDGLRGEVPLTTDKLQRFRRAKETNTSDRNKWEDLWVRYFAERCPF